MSLDPAIIERYAKLMELKAGSRVARFTILGIALGGILGAMPLVAGKIHLVHTFIPARYGFALAIAGAAAGGYLGYLIGQSRAVALRLQAHVAVHQLEVERLIRKLDGMRLPMAEPDRAVLAPPAPAPAPAPAAPAPLPAQPAPAPAAVAPPPPPPPPVPLPESMPLPAPPAPFSFPPASMPPAQAAPPAPVFPPPAPFVVPDVPVSEPVAAAEPTPSPAPLQAVPTPAPFSLPAPVPEPEPAPEPQQELEPPTVQYATPDWQLPPVNAVRTNP
jgi:hypothetical protein